MENQEDALSPSERRVATAIRNQPPGRTPECPAPESIRDLVRRRVAEPAARQLRAHITFCAHCSNLYDDMLRSWQLATALQKEALADASASGTAPPVLLRDRRRTASGPSFGQWFVPALGFGLAGAAAAGLIIHLAAARPSQMKVATLQAQVRRLQEENERQAGGAANLQKQIAQLRQANDALQKQVAGATAQFAQPSPQGRQDNAALRKQAQEADALRQRVVQLRQQNQVGQDTIGRLQTQVAALTEAALNEQQIVISPEVARLRGRQGTLAGDPEAGVPFRLMSPVATVVRTDRPLFRWQPLQGAQGYRVLIMSDADDKVVQQSDPDKPLLETAWRPPRPLPRGRVYRWMVTAVRGDGEEVASPRPPAPPARFRVLEQAAAEELSRAERTYAGSHLLLGLLYAREGLLEDAERELNALVRTNPDSVTARKLRDQIREARLPSRRR